MEKGNQKMHVYLDNSATTKQSPEVVRTMVRIMEEQYGNPSSLHRMGVEAEKAVKSARKKIAAAAGARDEEIYFTSCGTESDNTAIFGVCRMLRRQGNHIITSHTEHAAVLESFKRMKQEGMEVTILESDAEGFVRMDRLEDALNDQTILVSVMHVNNESGAIQPVRKIGELIRKKAPKALFHCDAVQSFGKLPVQVHENGIDLLSASAHKIHGPKGMGMLYVRKGIHLPPYLCGGGQESGMRSGTENVPGIAGFGVAAEAAFTNMEKNLSYVGSLKDHLLAGIRANIPDILVNSPEHDCLPHILNVSFLGTRGEVLLHMLEQSGIFVSTGSACSSHGKGGSHVLAAMGRSPQEIEGAVRFSLSPYNTLEEMDYVLEKLTEAVKDHRKMMSIAAGAKRRR